MSAFGEELRRLMKAKGLTQEQLAAKIGTKQSFVSKLIRGEREGIGAGVLFQMCSAFGVPADHFAPYLAPGATVPPPPAPTPKLHKVQRAEPGTGRFIPDLGKVAAGVAIDPKADHDLVEVWGLPDSGEFVTFTVAGDSMVGALIASGDQVIVRLQPTADSGEEVVCQIDGRLTLKTYHVGKGERKGLWLLPHNDECEPIRIQDVDDPRIIGVLYEVRRQASNRRRPKGRGKK